VTFAWLGLQALAGSVDIVSIAVVAIVAGAGVALVDDAEQDTAAAVTPTGSATEAGGRLAVPEVVSDGFLGIPAGALLFAVIPGAPFLVAAGIYTIAALLALTVPHAPSASTGPVPDGTLMPGAVARSALSSGVLVGGAVAIGVSLLGSAVAGPLVLVGLDELGLEAAGVGALLTAMAAGSLAGGVLAPELGDRLGTTAALAGALLVGAAGYGAAGLVEGTLAVGAALTAASLATMAAMVLARRHRAGDALSRRALHAVCWAAIPLGAVAGGLVAEAWGLHAPLLAAGAGLALLVPLVPTASRPGPSTTALTRRPVLAEIG